MATVSLCFQESTEIMATGLTCKEEFDAIDNDDDYVEGDWI